MNTLRRCGGGAAPVAEALEGVCLALGQEDGEADVVGLGLGLG